MKRPWDAIAWWEVRRIPFNLVLLVTGTCSGFFALVAADHLYGASGNAGSPLISAVVYGIAANLCYTLGWITELLWSWGKTAQTEQTRHKVFRVGLIFSVGVTLIPGIVLGLMWAAKGFR